LTSCKLNSCLIVTQNLFLQKVFFEIEFLEKKKTYILLLLLLFFWKILRGDTNLVMIALFAKQLLLGFESCKCNHLPRKYIAAQLA